MFLLASSATLFGCAKPSVNRATADSLSAKRPKFIIETPKGAIAIELFEDTPIHTENFSKLVDKKFYDGTSFWRLVPGLLIQGGDPDTREKPMPELDSLGKKTLPAEIKHSHFRGTIGAARQDDDVNPKRESSSCQFYININDNRFLDGSYTVFGRVMDSVSMDVVDRISKTPRDGQNVPTVRQWMRIRRADE